jgi:ubiquinone/menaquinone biosynthesis C-methylase UbiE
MSISFDRAADYYDETRGFPPGTETQAAATIARAGGFSGGEQVLEIGVGTGRIALPVAPYVRRYFGIDISTQMMNRLLNKRGDEPISLTQGSATHLPFPNATFNAAVAVHVFHLIPGWQQALSELARVLKPDGRLIHCWNNNDQVIDIQALIKSRGDDGRAEVVGARGTTYLEDLGWQAGVEEVCSFTRQQRPVDVLDQMRRRVWSRTWRLTDDELAERLKVLQEALEEQFSDIHAPVEVESTFHAKVYAPPR